LQGLVVAMPLLTPLRLGLAAPHAASKLQFVASPLKKTPFIGVFLLHQSF
jgi:hypothetical protein